MISGQFTDFPIDFPIDFPDSFPLEEDKADKDKIYELGTSNLKQQSQPNSPTASISRDSKKIKKIPKTPQETRLKPNQRNLMREEACTNESNTNHISGNSFLLEQFKVIENRKKALDEQCQDLNRQYQDLSKETEIFLAKMGPSQAGKVLTNLPGKPKENSILINERKTPENAPPHALEKQNQILQDKLNALQKNQKLLDEQNRLLKDENNTWRTAHQDKIIELMVLKAEKEASLSGKKK